MTNKLFLTTIILLTITASLLCINITYGYGENIYHSMRDGNDYTTLTITSLDSQTSTLDFISALDERYSIGSALYITFSEDCEAYIVGWDGSDRASLWISPINGRFFYENELAKGDDVVYVDDQTFSTIDQETGTYLINETEYDVIGYGIIARFNIYHVIGRNSPQELFPEAHGSVIENQDKLCNRFLLIPYKNYLEHGYTPELVLVRFSGVSRSELNSICDELSREFPNCTVTMPENNSDIMRATETMQYAVFGIILAFIVWISLIKIMNEWISENKVVMQVYLICGASRRKLKCVILLEYLIFFVFGMMLALITQRMLLGFLSFLGAGFMPTAAEAVVTMLAAYFLTVILSWHRIDECVKASKTIER